MRCKIFDSWDWMEMEDDYRENWKDYLPHEDTPPGEHDERISQMVWEDIRMNYYDLVSDFKSKTINGWLILDGELGLWWGRPDVCAVVTPEQALEWPHEDFSVYYEDGDIVIRQYHHDGTNVFKLLVIKPFEDVDLNGLSREAVQGILDCYDELESDNYFNTENMGSEVDRLYASAAPYFKDYLSTEALEDLERRKTEDPGYYVEGPVNV